LDWVSCLAGSCWGPQGCTSVHEYLGRTAGAAKTHHDHDHARGRRLGWRTLASASRDGADDERALTPLTGTVSPARPAAMRDAGGGGARPRDWHRARLSTAARQRGHPRADSFSGCAASTTSAGQRWGPISLSILPSVFPGMLSGRPGRRCALLQKNMASWCWMISSDTRSLK
jgi:hypothetical protein